MSEWRNVETDAPPPGAWLVYGRYKESEHYGYEVAVLDSKGWGWTAEYVNAEWWMPLPSAPGASVQPPDAREAALDALVRESEELGLYDLPADQQESIHIAGDVHTSEPLIRSDAIKDSDKL